MSKLQEIKQALLGCSSGEWIRSSYEIASSDSPSWSIGEFTSKEDAKLVVLLKNNISQIIEQLEQAQTANQKLVDALERIERCNMSIFYDGDDMASHMLKIARQTLGEVKGNG